MARERMVTRTVTVTSIEVMCLDVSTAEVKIETFELSGFYENAEHALKPLRKAHETSTFKLVAVQSMSNQDVLYGMPEIDFIKVAKVLPPRFKSNENDSE